MARLLATMSMTLFCMSTLGEAAICDKTIINNIYEKFWDNGKNTPQGLLKEGKEMSPGYISKTTIGYYPDEDEICCAFLVYEDADVKLYTKYKNSTKAVLTSFADIVEKDGVLCHEESGECRYVLSKCNGKGVRCFYKCSESGESGSPQGLIETAASGYDKDALNKCIKDLGSLGIFVSSKTFEENCAPE